MGWSIAPRPTHSLSGVAIVGSLQHLFLFLSLSLPFLQRPAISFRSPVIPSASSGSGSVRPTPILIFHVQGHAPQWLDQQQACDCLETWDADRFALSIWGSSSLFLWASTRSQLFRFSWPVVCVDKRSRITTATSLLVITQRRQRKNHREMDQDSSLMTQTITELVDSQPMCLHGKLLLASKCSLADLTHSYSRISEVVVLQTLGWVLLKLFVCLKNSVGIKSTGSNLGSGTYFLWLLRQVT